ncbi:MAG: acetate kinase [Deltaproteobacteria bacterium]|jgi:acetate kinase|nr:acetate kinase [Deltaproteobacteria bacterium]MBW2483022.1 acetate kinase [Deltaproteobacteria bacterium]
MKVLVINSGSSSIKYQLFDMSDKTVLAKGLLEQIGEAESRLTHRSLTRVGDSVEVTRKQPVTNHQVGFQLIGDVLNQSGAVGDSSELFGIGHRVVHGGEAFQTPALIDEKVVTAIRALIPLAPLHNPANLAGIEVALKFAPRVPQVAVFDTAFHQSVPPQAFRYALPNDLYHDHNVRRYGFHGTSHFYVAKQAAGYLKRALASLNLITLHLGNGASVTAIANGKSVDTSMGMTPLEGLIMGTRSGDIDPAIIFYLGRQTGLAPDEIESLLNKNSGLKGICGLNDMRAIAQSAAEGDASARLAIEMYCYRIKKYIGAYHAVLGDVDALVFTGGIGENAANIRLRSCEGLSCFGIEVDAKRNQLKSKTSGAIQSDRSRVKILVVPTDEELEIAVQTIAKIRSLS